MSDAQDLLEYLMGTNPSRKRDALDDLVQVTMDKICEEGLYDKERKKWMKNGREMFDGVDQKGDVMTITRAIQQIAAQHSTPGGPLRSQPRIPTMSTTRIDTPSAAIPNMSELHFRPRDVKDVKIEGGYSTDVFESPQILEIKRKFRSGVHRKHDVVTLTWAL